MEEKIKLKFWKRRPSGRELSPGKKAQEEYFPINQPKAYMAQQEHSETIPQPHSNPPVFSIHLSITIGVPTAGFRRKRGILLSGNRVQRFRFIKPWRAKGILKCPPHHSFFTRLARGCLGK